MNPMLRDELVAILTEAAPPQPADLDIEPIDVSWRARTMRSIMRIAWQHGWQDAITMFLETKRVPYLSDLTDPQLADLMDRMNGYVEAAETGASLPDCLPAS